jgi:hypothetical protein
MAGHFAFHRPCGPADGGICERVVPLRADAVSSPFHTSYEMFVVLHWKGGGYEPGAPFRVPNLVVNGQRSE